jgi:hypothetical protein
LLDGRCGFLFVERHVLRCKFVVAKKQLAKEQFQPLTHFDLAA